MLSLQIMKSGSAKIDFAIQEQQKTQCLEAAKFASETRLLRIETAIRERVTAY